MIHLRTYENFFKNTWKKLVDSGGSGDRVFKAEWNDRERVELDKYNFVLSSGMAIYQSQSTDLKVVIRKIFVEIVVGHADSVFSLQMSFQKNRLVHPKEFKDFDEIVKILKDTIPEEELMANKYNI